MTRRPVVLAGGPLLAMLAILPLPEPLRAMAGLFAVLLGLPLALLPFWWPVSGAGPVEAAVRRAARLLVLIPLPFTVLTAAGLAGVPTALLARTLVSLQVVAALAGLIRLRRPASGTGRAEGSPGAGDGLARTTAVGLLLPVFLVLLVGARLGAPLGAADDALDHLAAVRHLVASDRVTFPGAYYAVDPPVGQDPRKGVVHTALALAAVAAGVDPAITWRSSAGVMAPLLALGFGALALALFRRPRAALLAPLGLLFVAADPLWLFKGGYGGHAGLGVAWGAAAGLLAGGGVRFGLLAGLATASVHAYAPVQLLAPLGLAWLLSGRPPRRGADGEPAPPRPRLGPLLAVAAGALPVEAARWLLAGPATNPLHGQSMPWLLLPPGPIASPLALLDWYGWAGFLAAPILVLVRPWRRDGAGPYLVASLLAPALLLLNPWLFGPVADRLGSVANKLALVWIYPMVAVWLLDGVLEDRLGRPARLASGVGLALMAAALLPDLPARLRALGNPSPASPATLTAAAAAMIARATPADAVIAADPMLSYAVPALTGRRVIATLHQHSPPGDGRAAERLAVAATLEAACVPRPQALERARREGATHLLRPPPAGRRSDQFGAHRDPRNEPALAARFAPEGPDLVLVDEADGFRLWRIGETAPGLPDPPAGPPRSGPVPPPTAVMVEDGEVTLAVESGGPARLGRGAVLRLPAWWRRDGVGEAGAPGYPETYREYQGHLRMEFESVRGGGGLSKLWRRLVEEPRRGGSLRARGVELPFRGLCPVGEWPADTWLPDTLEVRVAEGLVPGPYRLLLSLEKVTLYARLTPADLFSNEDRFSGRFLTRIEIR